MEVIEIKIEVIEIKPEIKLLNTKIAILRPKKELLVLKYINRGYIVIDKNLYRYTYKYDPIANIILPFK